MWHIVRTKKDTHCPLADGGISVQQTFTFAIATLGCKVNQYDSWQLARALRAKGFRQVPFGAPADVIIVNSCTVTHVAEAKSRKLVARARRLAPHGIVVLTGCAAEVMERQGVSLPQVDLLAGNTAKPDLPDRILALLRERGQQVASSLPDPTPYAQPLLDEPDDETHERARAFLKVQEGCDKFCTFCVIPFTRGQPRSKPIEQVSEEAAELVNDLGFREIVLTGVCLTLWGREWGLRLTDLLRRLHDLDGLMRLRLSSLDPRDLDEEFARCCAELPKVCRHFHISLQAGDDALLKAMGRGHDRAYFRSLVATFRRYMPDAAFTTDVMVGFPGETEEQFANTVAFVREIGFMHLHVFRFSPRPGTIAATLRPTVPAEVAEGRAAQLIAIGKELWAQFARQFLGTERTVLVETCRPIGDALLPEGFELSGLTDNYLRVRWTSDRPIPIGTLVSVRLVRLHEQGFVVGEAG